MNKENTCPMDLYKRITWLKSIINISFDLKEATRYRPPHCTQIALPNI